MGLLMAPIYLIRFDPVEPIGEDGLKVPASKHVACGRSILLSYAAKLKSVLVNLDDGKLWLLAGNSVPFDLVPIRARRDLLLSVGQGCCDEPLKAVEIRGAAVAGFAALGAREQSARLQGRNALLDRARLHANRFGDGLDRRARQVVRMPPIVRQMDNDVHVHGV